ncbi:MAG: hypothetical protein L0Y39_06725 [Methylococcaceae bacterium]|nr:hypothetical protein [Methylococcaceae bacterium]
MSKQDAVEQDQLILQSRYAMVEEAVIILMVILSLIGIAVMRFSPTEGYWYWVVITLVFGLCAMLIGFVQTRQGRHVVRDIWVEQSLLWFGVVLSLCGSLLLLQFEQLTDQNTGLVILLILSLAIYIDGLRIGWRFALVGNFLGLAAVSIAYTEKFISLLFSIAAITIAITVVWQRRIAARQKKP